MADKFFDSNNNMIYWGEASDLTEATKYKGSKIGMVGTSESLVKKIVKGEVEIGAVSLPTPNENQVVLDWGGGIKTYYKYGEPMYIPRAFLEEGITYYGSSNMDSTYVASSSYKDSQYLAPVKDNIGNHIGYQTWFNDGTTTGTRSEGKSEWIGVYRLPQELGEYLYSKAESFPNSPCYGTSDSASNRVYKSIATYTDALSNGSGWTGANNWKINIRRKSELNIVGHSTTSGTPFSTTYVNDNLPQYISLDDDAYYLVVTVRTNPSSTEHIVHSLAQGVFPKDEFIWMRSFKDMTAIPNGTTMMGKKMLYHPEHNAKPLGGRIFYIDPEDNGATYTFLDASGNVVSGSTVSDYADAVFYLVEGTPSKDKFYVYYPTKFDSLKWGYGGKKIGVTGTAVGTGKTNTATVMARTDIETGTIWSNLSEIRTSSGIDDLFIPSKDEIDKFREADLEAWCRSSGGSSLFSSSESSYYAMAWISYLQRWITEERGVSRSVFLTRSF